MSSVTENLRAVEQTLPEGVTLVAVSKTYPPEMIREAYDAGVRDFGENRPQELTQKFEQLPNDIRWHMIGTLQRNKVKQIAPFVHLIHSVDSVRLLETIDKEAQKNGRVIDVLMEVHIADEESKHGWEAKELTAFWTSGGAEAFKHVRIRGLMGMATYTDNTQQVLSEFDTLKQLFDKLKPGRPDFSILSMGMSGDYEIAIAAGATMVRVGSAIFGLRTYN